MNIKKPDMNNLNPLQDLQEAQNSINKEINDYAKLQTKLAKEMGKIFALPENYFRCSNKTATEIQTEQRYSQHVTTNAADIYAPKLMIHLKILFGEKLLKYTKGKARRKIRRILRKLRRGIK